jgi:hypothetical protein
VIDAGAALALDHLAAGVRLGDDEKLFIERVGNCRVDCRKPNAAEAPAVFQSMIADKAHARFMDALSLGVELGEAAVGAILGEHPIQRSRYSD